MKLEFFIKIIEGDFQCHFQDTRTEIREDVKGANRTSVVCKWCIFYSRWMSHRQRLSWWHSEGTLLMFRCPSLLLLTFGSVNLTHYLYILLHLRSGTQSPGNVSTLTDRCPRRQKSLSTMWSPYLNTQSTLWCVTTLTPWLSWTCTARWDKHKPLYRDDQFHICKKI